MTVVLKVHDIECRYGARTVLDGITFSVDPGTFLGVIGPNGSGKSTLIKTLAATVKPSIGIVWLDGRDLSTIKVKDLAKKVGVVPQDTRVDFTFTTEEVVLMGRHAHLGRFHVEGIRDRLVAQKAMEMTDTWGLRHRPVTHLSGGERQRVLLARALTQEPQLLLLDEPTAHLDINYQVEILSLLRKLVLEEKLTVIGVLHDLNLASQFCQRLLLLHQGNIFAAGDPEEVITPEHIREVFRAEVGIARHPITGVPQVTLLTPKTGTEKSHLKVHLIGGGGVSGWMMDQLASRGYTVTAGVLNAGDTDWQRARDLGLIMAEEAPFSPIGDEAYRRNLELIGEAGAVVLLQVPFGHGNLRNIECLAHAIRLGVPVLVVSPHELSQRDYTGGQAVEFLHSLPAGGWQGVNYQEAVLAFLAGLESRTRLSEPGL